MALKLDKENLMGIGWQILKIALLCIKHCFLAIWWLFRVEIWLFYYWCIGRWLLGLSLYFPRYNDIWYKKKPKHHNVISSNNSTSDLKKNSPQTVMKNKQSTSTKEEMRIPKVENGMVKIYNKSGLLLTTMRPGNGNPILADVHPSSGDVIITTTQGSVFIYNKNGNGRMGGNGGLTTNTDVKKARWQGNDILVEYTNGKSQLRSLSGNVIRDL